eukprot:13867363-Alexandrium_andersonii.AAC.1
MRLRAGVGSGGGSPPEGAQETAVTCGKPYSTDAVARRSTTTAPSHEPTLLRDALFHVLSTGA